MVIGNVIGIPFRNFTGSRGLDTTPPILSSIEIGTVAANIITMRYNERLDETSIPLITAYSLSGTVETIISVTISNRVVLLTLSGNVEYDNVVLLTYVAGTNPIRDIALNEAINLTNEPVINNILLANTFLRPDGSPFLRPDGSVFLRPI